MPALLVTSWGLSFSSCHYTKVTRQKQFHGRQIDFNSQFKEQSLAVGKSRQELEDAACILFLSTDREQCMHPVALFVSFGYPIQDPSQGPVPITVGQSSYLN